MKSKDRVLMALGHSLKGRVPRDLWTLPWADIHYPGTVSKIQKQFPNDIDRSPEFYRKPPLRRGDRYVRGAYLDEWGCCFENIQPGVIGEVKQPPIPSWDMAGEMRIPEETLSVDVAEVNRFCRQSESFILAAACARPFERLQFLRGTENVLVDLMMGLASFNELLSRIHDFYCREMELWASTEVDGLFFMDDWGSQDSLLISPRLWRERFKPLYRDYIDIAHSAGKKIFMHSDGYILDIIPDLIELDLDALNAQIFCMGLENLSPFKGSLTFWGEIDRQYLLSEADSDEIDRAVNQVFQSLYADGGLIAQCEFGPGAKPGNVAQVFMSWDNVSGK